MFASHPSRQREVLLERKLPGICSKFLSFKVLPHPFYRSILTIPGEVSWKGIEAPFGRGYVAVLRFSSRANLEPGSLD